MDYTKIIEAVIALVAAALSTFLIPLIKEKIDSEKLRKVQTYVDIAVTAAEQIYNACDGEVKKAYVLNYLAEKGIQFDAETVERMIEASVLMLHNELYGVEKKGGEPS